MHVRSAPWVHRSAGLIAFALVLAALPAREAGALSGIRDAEIERFLRDQAEPVFRAAGLEPSSVDLYVINDPSLNAFVAGGQNIFVFTGLMLAADAPNELLGVLAHETGHIAGGHIARSSDAIQKATVPMVISMLAGIAAAAAGAPDAGIAILAGSQTFAERSILAYSRGQEAAADQAALTYLDAIGQSGEGLLRFFERFRDQEILTYRQQDPFVRSHPLSSDRLAALRHRVEQSPHRARSDTPEMQQRYALIKGKLQGFIGRPDVTFRVYPDRDQSLAARYARTVAHYKIPDLGKALSEIDGLIAAMPDNPYFHELKGQILFENGRAGDALPAHRRAVALAPGESLLHLNLGQALLAVDEERPEASLREDARRHLMQALTLEPDNAAAWAQLAILHARNGEEALAALATAERYFAAGAMPEALRFATRARPGLKEGSEARRRAEDIAHAAKRALPKERDERRAPPLTTLNAE